MHVYYQNVENPTYPCITFHLHSVHPYGNGIAVEYNYYFFEHSFETYRASGAAFAGMTKQECEEQAWALANRLAASWEARRK